jgi:hypothetical protein
MRLMGWEIQYISVVVDSVVTHLIIQHNRMALLKIYGITVLPVIT